MKIYVKSLSFESMLPVANFANMWIKSCLYKYQF